MYVQQDLGGVFSTLAKAGANVLKAGSAVAKVVKPSLLANIAKAATSVLPVALQVYQSQQAVKAAQAQAAPMQPAPAPTQASPIVALDPNAPHVATTSAAAPTPTAQAPALQIAGVSVSKEMLLLGGVGLLALLLLRSR